MATDEQAQALGLITPHGTDPIRDGDNAIRQNAHVLTDLNTQIKNRLDHLDTLAAGDVDSVNGHTGTVTLTAADVGALPASWRPAWSDVTGTPDTYPPSAHAASHAAGGADELTPAAIGAVPMQDTGWRRILTWTDGVQDTGNQLGTINTTDYVLSGSGYLDIRRVREWVYLRSASPANDRIATTTTAPNRSFIDADLPPGFRITGGGGGCSVTITADSPGTVEIRSNGSAGFGFPTRSGPANLTRLNGAWWTFEDFPTTLPGTPA